MDNAGKNPGDKEDEGQKSKSPQKSKDGSKPIPNLMIHIPVEYLSEKQKKLLNQKSLSKDEPSTSSEKVEDVFKVPRVPPPRKKGVSPSKASSEIASKPLSTSVVHTVQDASLEESTTLEKMGDIPLEEEAKNETQDSNLN